MSRELGDLMSAMDAFCFNRLVQLPCAIGSFNSYLRLGKRTWQIITAIVKNQAMYFCNPNTMACNALNSMSDPTMLGYNPLPSKTTPKLFYFESGRRESDGTIMTRVLVVEDNVLLATTLQRFLSDHGKLTVVAVAPSAEIALEKLLLLKVDLVLVDVALPGMSGIELVATIQRMFPQVPCLILSGHNEIHYVRRALDAGAKGYVVKNDPFSILVAVRQVLSGEIYLSEELRSKFYH